MCGRSQCINWLHLTGGPKPEKTAISLRNCLNLVFRIYYRLFFRQSRLFLSLVPIGTGRKKAAEWRKKRHNKTERLNSYSFSGFKISEAEAQAFLSFVSAYLALLLSLAFVLLSFFSLLLHFLLSLLLLHSLLLKLHLFLVLRFS